MRSAYPILSIILLIISACNSQYRGAGWYYVADYPDNTIIGKPLATVKDFEWVVLKRDTFVIERDTVKRMCIYGIVKPEKRKIWADGTERLIGHRLGFVYKDSVIMAPNVNARIESGSFEIVSPDTTLLKTIYESISTSSIK